MQGLIVIMLTGFRVSFLLMTHIEILLLSGSGTCGTIERVVKMNFTNSIPLDILSTEFLFDGLRVALRLRKQRHDSALRRLFIIVLERFLLAKARIVLLLPLVLVVAFLTSSENRRVLSLNQISLFPN